VGGWLGGEGNKSSRSRVVRVCVCVCVSLFFSANLWWMDTYSSVGGWMDGLMDGLMDGMQGYLTEEGIGVVGVYAACMQLLSDR